MKKEKEYVGIRCKACGSEFGVAVDDLIDIDGNNYTDCIICKSTILVKYQPRKK